MVKHIYCKVYPIAKESFSEGVGWQRASKLFCQILLINDVLNMWQKANYTFYFITCGQSLQLHQ